MWLCQEYAVEKHELGKIDFDLIDDAFKALLQSHPDPTNNGRQDR
jgi:hypothetical protein